MNTIKIYLAESGALAQLQKDFPLYQYQFNNKLLNIYVPKSICAGPFIDEEVSEGFACQIKMDYMDSQNKQHRTGAFYCRYVDKQTPIIINGVEYVLFERLLPYAFTLYAGQGVGAPTLTITIVNVAEYDNAPAVVSTISSQECALDVLPSTPVADIDEPVDADVVTELEAKLTTIITQLATKQNADTTNDGVGKVINADGVDHTVVGNINKVLQDNSTQQSSIDELASDMVDVKADIVNLYNMIGTSLNNIGVMQVNNSLPTDAQVTAWVESPAGAGRAPQANDAVVVEVLKTGDPDEVYMYLFNGVSWSHFAIQYMNKAQNGDMGIIEGNYTLAGLSESNNLMVDINDGVITNIYYVNADGNYIDYKDMSDQVIKKLKLGTTPVSMAQHDDDGNDIVDTYMTKSAGATKTYVQNYASPKGWDDSNDANYSQGTYKDTNVNDNSYNKTITVAQVGYSDLVNMTLRLKSDILLGDQNGATQKIWLASTNTENVKLRFEIYYPIDNVSIVLAGTAVETDTISLVANTPKQISVEYLFDKITTPTTAPQGQFFHVLIDIWREESTSADFTLLSSETYPAYMELNKIGFVRYSLELEPSELESGHDGSPTIDANGDLKVQSTGTIKYENDEVAPLDYNIKIPMDNGLTDGTSVKPARAGQVKGALDGKLDKVTGATTYGQVYVKTNGGSQSTANYSTNAIAGGIVQRDLDSQINVPQTPTSDNHATSKKYVDDGFQAKVVVNTTATSPITLANNTSFRLGTISALTITNPSEYALDFECEVIFTADTGISMTYSAVSPTWSGDDVSGGVFTPVDGKTYNILFFNNATAVATPSIQAIVRGV